MKRTIKAGMTALFLSAITVVSAGTAAFNVVSASALDRGEYNQTTVYSENAQIARTDGSILTNKGYIDTMWGMTMSFPESWQKDNILVLNNQGEKGRTLSFVEKTNYASNKNFGLIFRLEATYEPVEDNNNYKNLGSFTDANGRLWYLSIFTPSDVRADLSDKALTENYRQVFCQKNNAVASIFMYN